MSLHKKPSIICLRFCVSHPHSFKVFVHKTSPLLFFNIRAMSFMLQGTHFIRFTKLSVHISYGCTRASNKDTPSWLQKLLSFRYQTPNQIPIEGTVSNPEFEPNQISATLDQSRMRTGQASILVKVIKMSKYWRKTSKNKGSGVNLGCPSLGQYDYLLVRAI